MVHVNARLRRFFRSRKGNIAIISAITLPVVVGFCGLAAEAGYWFYRHRDIQGAADVAAFGATVVLRRGGTYDDVKTAATNDAKSNGWRQAIGSIQVHAPPTSGTHQNNLSVEVLLTENEPRFFTKVLYGNTPFPIIVRSVGTYASAGPACFLSLHPTAASAMDFHGNVTASFSGCNAVANSNNATAFTVWGSAILNIPCVQAVGGFGIQATLNLTQCTATTSGAEPTPDPYGGLPEPPEATQACKPNPAPTYVGADGKTHYTPGHYCQGLNLNGGNFVLDPGTYAVDPSAGGVGFRTGATANVYAHGVTIYLNNNAPLQLNGTSHLDITAPTTGTYHGIAFFGDRTNNSAVLAQINGDNTSTITGAMYFPAQTVRFAGNFSGVAGCMQVVASMIDYQGNANFTTNCTGTGVTQIPTPGVVSLAE